MASGPVNRIYRPNTWQHRPDVINYALFEVLCWMVRRGSCEKSGLSPSAIVGCAKAVSVSVEYESRANIAVRIARNS